MHDTVSPSTAQTSPGRVARDAPGASATHGKPLNPGAQGSTHAAQALTYYGGPPPPTSQQQQQQQPQSPPFYYAAAPGGEGAAGWHPAPLLPHGFASMALPPHHPHPQQQHHHPAAAFSMTPVAGAAPPYYPHGAYAGPHGAAPMFAPMVHPTAAALYTTAGTAINAMPSPASSSYPTPQFVQTGVQPTYHHHDSQQQQQPPAPTLHFLGASSSPWAMSTPPGAINKGMPSSSSSGAAPGGSKSPLLQPTHGGGQPAANHTSQPQQQQQPSGQSSQPSHTATAGDGQSYTATAAAFSALNASSATPQTHQRATGDVDGLAGGAPRAPSAPSSAKPTSGQPDAPPPPRLTDFPIAPTQWTFAFPSEPVAGGGGVGAASGAPLGSTPQTPVMPMAMHHHPTPTRHPSQGGPPPTMYYVHLAPSASDPNLHMAPPSAGAAPLALGSGYATPMMFAAYPSPYGPPQYPPVAGYGPPLPPGVTGPVMMMGVSPPQQQQQPGAVLGQEAGPSSASSTPASAVRNRTSPLGAVRQYPPPAAAAGYGTTPPSASVPPFNVALPQGVGGQGGRRVVSSGKSGLPPATLPSSSSFNFGSSSDVLGSTGRDAVDADGVPLLTTALQHAIDADEDAGGGPMPTSAQPAAGGLATATVAEGLALIHELRRDAVDRNIAHRLISCPPAQCESVRRALEADPDLVLQLCEHERARIVHTIIERYGADACPNMLTTILRHFVFLSCTQRGCIAIPRIIAAVKQDVADQLFEVCERHLPRLACDRFGNYVCNHFTGHGRQEILARMCRRFSEQPDFSAVTAVDKYGSYVVDELLKRGNATSLRPLLNHIFLRSSRELRALAADPCGNYIVQAAFDSVHRNQADDDLKAYSDAMWPLISHSPFGVNIAKHIHGTANTAVAGGTAGSAAAQGAGTSPSKRDPPQAPPRAGGNGHRSDNGSSDPPADPSATTPLSPLSPS